MEDYSFGFQSGHIFLSVSGSQWSIIQDITNNKSVKLSLKEERQKHFFPHRLDHYQSNWTANGKVNPMHFMFFLFFPPCPFDQLQVPENAREWFDNHRLYNKLPPGQTNCSCDQQGFDGQQPVLKHQPLNISIGDSCDSFCRWNFSPWRRTSKISTGTWQLDMEPKCVPIDMAPTAVHRNKKQTNKPLRAKAALNAGKGVLLVGGSSRWVCKKRLFRALWY